MDFLETSPLPFAHFSRTRELPLGDDRSETWKWAGRDWPARWSLQLHAIIGVSHRCAGIDQCRIAFLREGAIHDKHLLPSCTGPRRRAMSRSIAIFYVCPRESPARRLPHDDRGPTDRCPGRFDSSCRARPATSAPRPSTRRLFEISIPRTGTLAGEMRSTTAPGRAVTSRAANNTAPYQHAPYVCSHLQIAHKARRPCARHRVSPAAVHIKTTSSTYGCNAICALTRYGDAIGHRRSVTLRRDGASAREPRRSGARPNE